MKYKINLSFNEFLVSQNPTWTFGTQSYVTEIALLDENQDILVMSKLQSPVLRQGIQQYVVKVRFLIKLQFLFLCSYNNKTLLFMKKI
jgi:hypothetical protein